MKVKCIENDSWQYLTIGKLYNVICEDVNRYLIKNDDFFNAWYGKYYFKTLSEIRNDKIDKLLDEL